MKSRVIHFDLSADDPKRAVKFYRAVFNWKVNKWEGPEDYWLFQTGSEKEPGITGGIAKRIKPEDTTTAIFDVASVDDAIRKVVDAGGNVREEKRPIPGIGYFATCIDTEGNSFGVMEIDENAS